MSHRFLVFTITLLAYTLMGVAASAGQWSALPLYRVAGFYSDDFYNHAAATQTDPLIIPPTGSYDLNLLNVDINDNITGPLTHDIDEFSDPWPFPEDDMIIGRWEVYVNGQLEYYSDTTEVLDKVYDYSTATEETIIEIKWFAKDTGIHGGVYYTAADDHKALEWDLEGSIWLKVGSGSLEFTDITAVHPAAKCGDQVIVNFKASEALSANPIVTVNGSPALHSSNNGVNYSYSYQIGTSEPLGEAVIRITGYGINGPGQATDTDALWIVDCATNSNCEGGGFSYDRNGHLKTICDQRGLTVLSYDVIGRIVKVVEPDGKFISYEYDPTSNRQSMTDYYGGITSYTYNDSGTISSITDRNGEIQSYDYNSDGLIKRITYSNGAYTEYNFNSQFSLDTLVNRLPDGSFLTGYQFYYDSTDDNNNSWPGKTLVTRVVETLRLTDSYQTATIYYAYDDEYQVVRERRVGPMSFDRNYTYDDGGNRSSITNKDVNGAIISSKNYTYDSYGRISSAGNVTFSYDIDTRTISRSDGYSYVYDNNFRLIELRQGDSVMAYFQYDALGRIVSYSESDGNTSYIRYDLGSMVSESDDSNHVVHYMLDDIGMSYGASYSSGDKYYHHDDMGNITAVTTGQPGEVEAWAATYDVFGVRQIIDAESLNLINSYIYSSLMRDTGLSKGHPQSRAKGQHHDPTLPAGSSGVLMMSGNPAGLPFSPHEGAQYTIQPAYPTFYWPSGIIRPSGYDPCQPGGDWLDKSSNFFAGWGDALSLGATGRVRMWIGVDDFVDENSLWYHGGEAIGIAHSMAIPASKAGPWIGRRPNGKLYDPKWKNRRKVLLNRGIADPGVDMHHWLFKQSHPIARRYPHFFNQPWNLVKATKAHHRLLHGNNVKPSNVLKYGIPNWAKVEALLLGGHGGRYTYRFLFD